MSQFKCIRCDKIFKLKTDLQRHQNRKYPCKELIVNPSKINVIKVNKINKKENKKLKCEYCKKEISRNDALKRHTEKYCKIKKQKDNKIIEKDNKIIEKDNEIKQLKKEINKLKKNQNINIQNMNTGNQNIN